MGWRIARNTLDGHVEEASAEIRQLRARGEELGIAEYARIVEWQVGPNNLLLGDRDETRRQLTGLANQYVRGYYLAQLGQQAEALDLLEKWVIDRPNFGTVADQAPVNADTALLDAALLVGHRKSVEMLLGKWADTTMQLAFWMGVKCIPQYLGAGAAFLGRHDEARRYYHQAIKVCSETRFRPGLALTRLQLAELLLDHYPAEKKDALEHLDFAIKEFREMKMRPSLERALRHKEILKA